MAAKLLKDYPCYCCVCLGGTVVCKDMFKDRLTVCLTQKGKQRKSR